MHYHSELGPSVCRVGVLNPQKVTTMLPLFTKTLVRARQVRTFEVAALPNVGWEACERAGVDVIDQRRYSDWHRVERVLTRFDREINELRRQGWVDA